MGFFTHLVRRPRRLFDQLVDVDAEVVVGRDSTGALVTAWQADAYKELVAAVIPMSENEVLEEAQLGVTANVHGYLWQLENGKLPLVGTDDHLRFRDQAGAEHLLVVRYAVDEGFAGLYLHCVCSERTTG